MTTRIQTFAVIGLGTFGTTVARELTRFGNRVIGIDTNERAVSAVADDIGQAIILDARDDAALREAGLGDCDVAVVGIGQNLEANVLAAINAKMIGIPIVWAKATSRTHHRILTKIGVDRVVHPEDEVGRHVAQILHNPQVRDYVALGNGFHLMSFIVPEGRSGSPLSGLKLIDGAKLRCTGVMRGTEYIGGPGMECTLAAGDILMILGRRGHLRDFGATL